MERESDTRRIRMLFLGCCRCAAAAVLLLLLQFAATACGLSYATRVLYQVHLFLYFVYINCLFLYLC